MNGRRPYPQTCKAAAYVIFLTQPGINARSLWELWARHDVLKDYQRPELSILSVWVEEFVAERSEKLHQGEYKKV